MVVLDAPEILKLSPLFYPKVLMVKYQSQADETVPNGMISEARITTTLRSYNPELRGILERTFESLREMCNGT